MFVFMGMMASKYYLVFRKARQMISESLKKASLEILILAMLNNQDMYPYQMVQSLKARSDSRYSMIAGVAYPVLYRMQDKGFISCREEKVGKRRMVHIYHLEEPGREYLRVQYKDFFAVSDLIKEILDEGGHENGLKSKK